METKKEITRKFMLGVAIIVCSLLLSKLVLIPLVLFPGDESWRNWMITLYIISWPVMFFGIYLAGKEGYHLATSKYKEYHYKTIDSVKKHSKRAATAAVQHGKKAAEHVKRFSKKPPQQL